MCITSAADEVTRKALPRKKAWFDEEGEEATRKKTEVYRQIQQWRRRTRDDKYGHLRRAEKRINQRRSGPFAMR
jgi:hypothetical protein